MLLALDGARTICSSGVHVCLSWEANVLGVDASSGNSDRVGVDKPGGRLVRILRASFSDACVSAVSGGAEEAVVVGFGCEGVGVREPEPTTVWESKLDTPSIGGTLVALMPSVVLLSPAMKAASLSPPLENFSIPSLAILSLVRGDTSLGEIFLMPLCVDPVSGLPRFAPPALLVGLSFLFRGELLELEQ